ncbi:MAG: ABC transporter permease [Erysipelothrix sp.]|nr:ABC transporter permease [Erysipelothrix sp.]
MEKEKDSGFKVFLGKSMPTIRYTFKRILYLIPVAIGIAFILYLIIDQMPGDPAMAMMDPEKPVDKELLAAIQKQLGLDGPLYLRFYKWLVNLSKGNFGYSVLVGGGEVGAYLATAIMNTFRVNLLGYILAIVVSLVVGIKAAVDRRSFFDQFWTVFSLIGISMPSFFFAMVLIFVFVINLGWFPMNGMISPSLPSNASQYTIMMDMLRHMFLPVMVVFLGSLPGLFRYVRNSMLEVLNQDYIRTARAKGLRDKTVIYRHAFRNALLPIITVIGSMLPGLFSGSITVESIFVYPGVGNLLSRSINSRDRNVTMVLLVFFAVLQLISNLVVDVSYALVDPRIRVGGDSSE